MEEDSFPAIDRALNLLKQRLGVVNTKKDGIETLDLENRVDVIRNDEADDENMSVASSVLTTDSLDEKTFDLENGKEILDFSSTEKKSDADPAIMPIQNLKDQIIEFLEAKSKDDQYTSGRFSKASELARKVWRIKKASEWKMHRQKRNHSCNDEQVQTSFRYNRMRRFFQFWKRFYQIMGWYRRNFIIKHKLLWKNGRFFKHFSGEQCRELSQRLGKKTLALLYNKWRLKRQLFGALLKNYTEKSSH